MQFRIATKLAQHPYKHVFRAGWFQFSELEPWALHSTGISNILYIHWIKPIYVVNIEVLMSQHVQ